MSFKLSSGIYPFEYVRGTTPFNPVNMTIGCSVFPSKKGPLGPTLVTGGWDSFVKKYGNGDPQWSPAHSTLKPALKEMNVFYGNRIVNGALYAGISFFYDSANKKFFSLPFSTGSSQGYDEALRVSEVISFSDAIPEGKTITLDLGSTKITQVYNQSSNYTLSLLATQIQAELDKLGKAGSATVIKAWDKSDRKMEVKLTFNREFEAGDVVAFDIEGKPGIDKVTATANFTQDSDAILQALADNINQNAAIVATVIPADLPTLVITCANAGPVDLTLTPAANMTAGLTFESLVLREGHGVYDDRSLVVTLPEGLDALEISGSIEGTAVEVIVEEDAKVFDIFAENPGEWASSTSEGLGIKISGLDLGIQQRNRITFSDALVQNNEFTCSLGYGTNTWEVGPVTYANSSDETLAAIAAAIQAKMDEVLGEGGSATVEEVVGGSNNDRSILIISPDSSMEISINDALVTGGVSQPVAVVSQVIPNTPSTKSFNMEVYSRSSLATPLEAWNVSLSQQLDASGNQMYIEDRINKGAYVSDNIRIVVHTNDFSKLQETSQIQWLAGGDDGVLPTTAQLVAGWNDFADPEKITVRILINAGYGNVNIHQAMANIAAKRRDSVALLDMPSDSQSVQAALNYRQYEMNVNTCYAAVYSPDILVFNENTGTDIYVGPSGYAAAQICYTERTRAIWYAPAGLNRGICSGAKGVRVQYGEGDRDLLEPVQINPILDKKTNGVVIMGEYTTQTANDPLRDLHVRLLCNNIEIAMTDAMAYKLFEPNDEYLRTVMAKEVEDYLQPIKDSRGIRDFRVVSDITKEPAADVDLGVAVVNTYIKPVSSTKYIRLNNYILGSGVSFDEVIENGV